MPSDRAGPDRCLISSTTRRGGYIAASSRELLYPLAFSFVRRTPAADVALCIIRWTQGAGSATPARRRARGRWGHGPSRFVGLRDCLENHPNCALPEFRLASPLGLAVASLGVRLRPPYFVMRSRPNSKRFKGSPIHDSAAPWWGSRNVGLTSLAGCDSRERKTQGQVFGS